MMFRSNIGSKEGLAKAREPHSLRFLSNWFIKIRTLSPKTLLKGFCQRKIIARKNVIKEREVLFDADSRRQFLPVEYWKLRKFAVFINRRQNKQGFAQRRINFQSRTFDEIAKLLPIRCRHLQGSCSIIVETEPTIPDDLLPRIKTHNGKIAPLTSKAVRLAVFAKFDKRAKNCQAVHFLMT